MKKQCSVLSLEDYQTIHVLSLKGRRLSEIGKVVGRSKSVVSRVLARRYGFPAAWEAMDGFERGRWAHEEAKKRRCRKGYRLRLKDRQVRRDVIRKLTQEHWTPEEIAQRLGGDLSGSSISARAIYYFIQHERADLYQCLPERGKPRRRGGGTRKRKKQPVQGPPKVLIDLRPANADDRREPGHCEIDTIHSCRGGRGAVLTFTERSSRVTFFRKIPDLKAATVKAALRAILQSIPSSLCKSITADNGSEFELSTLYSLQSEFGIDFYYCHPYCSHERGGVERKNRNLRWYYPKGTNFDGVKGYEIIRAQDKINNRPMKCLGYRTPTETWNEMLTTHSRDIAA